VVWERQNLLQIFVLWKDPENHPLGKAIAKLGSYNTMRLAVDEDFDSGSEVLGSGLATISKKWVLLTAQKQTSLYPNQGSRLGLRRQGQRDHKLCHLIKFFAGAMHL
jgi:hypothetical protein